MVSSLNTTTSLCQDELIWFMLCLYLFSCSVLLCFLEKIKSNKNQKVIKCKPFGENNEEIFWSAAFISGNSMVFRYNCDDIICFWRWASVGTAVKPNLPSPGGDFFFSRLLTGTTHLQCFSFSVNKPNLFCPQGQSRPAAFKQPRSFTWTNSSLPGSRAGQVFLADSFFYVPF